MQKLKGSESAVPYKITKFVKTTYKSPTQVLLNPSSKQYVTNLLKFVHQNVSRYYDYNGEIYKNVHPSPPHDVVVVSKTHHDFYDEKLKNEPDPVK